MIEKRDTGEKDEFGGHHNGLGNESEIVRFQRKEKEMGVLWSKIDSIE